MKNIIKFNILASILIVISTSSLAQLAAPNADGISAGHAHLTVPNVAKHTEIWKLLGGEVMASGSLQVIQFPNVYIMLVEAEPTAPSTATSANHLGFEVQSYDLFKAKLEAVGASFFVDNAENGQILADLPDGVRIEVQEVEDLEQPIVFHHFHLGAEDQEGLRDWYVDVLSAESGERKGMPSAVVPGGRVDVIGVRGDVPVATQGTAIDHIGFEVDDMEAFAAKMERMGIEFNFGPIRMDALNLDIAFITDPVGTYIEITQGLVDSK